MDNEPATRPTLLVRLRDHRDGTAWAEFVELYGPLLYRYARRRGLQDADAADVTQDVLRSVARSIGGFHYDPSRGSFRGWLFTATRHALERSQAKGQRLPQAGNSQFEQIVQDQPAREPDDERGEWDQEFDRRLFDWAAERVRREVQSGTWDAFWRTAVEHQNPRAVSDALGMTVGAVYVAKSRVTARLRSLIAEAQAE
jgi:RNA polymerase sigma-70 factor (ECF subfamily)